MLFRSGPIDVHTEGALGATGYVTSSSNVQGAPAEEQVDPFHYDNVFSTCTATEAGVTADVTITNGFIVTTTEPEPVPVPTNPQPGYTITGTVPGANDNFRIVFNEQTTNADGLLTVNAAHMYLLGPTARGDVIIGQSVCGVTLVAGQHVADLSVAITDDPDPAARGGQVTYTVTVTNAGPDAASDVTLASTVAQDAAGGARILSATTSAGTCTARGKGAECALGTIVGGGSAVVTIVAKAPNSPKATTMSLTSEVSSAATDSDSTNNSDTESTALQ